MDTSGRSWGLYANSGQTSSSVYAFGNTLAVGQTLSISASFGFLTGGAAGGFGLQNSDGTNRFESFYIGGSSDAWKINDNGGQRDITGPTTTFNASTWNTATPSFLTFEFTQLANDEYSLVVNGSAITNSGLALTASDITQIRIFNFNAGEGEDHNQFFNSLSVIPEPSAFGAILGALALTCVGIRRRARR